jgi:mannuronan synthase
MAKIHTASNDPTNERVPEVTIGVKKPSLTTGSEHPETNIPFTAIIDGRQFSGASLSLVAASVSGLAGSELNGAERIVTLRFNFGAYAISVPIVAQVTQINSGKGLLKLDFIEPTGEHLPTLRYVLNSFVAGEVVSLNGLIGAKEKAIVGSQVNSTANLSVMQRARQISRVAATALATIALIAVAGKLATDRLFSSEVSQLALASQGGEAMRAISSGQIAILNPAAKKGEVVYAIRAVSGDTLNVVLPCDCKVKIANVAEGSTVLTGETILSLLRSGAPNRVEAIVSAEQAKKLLSGDVAVFSFVGGTTREILFVEGRDNIQPLSGSENLRATFALSEAVPETAVNAPVSVRIVNSTFRSVTKFFWN